MRRHRRRRFGRSKGRMRVLFTRQPWHGFLAALLAILALIGFWPSPVDQAVQGKISAAFGYLHGHGVPGWIDYSLLERSANVVLFIPLGIVASLAFTQRGWWQNTALGTAVSGCMELGQLLFLENRVPSVLDLVTNTTGCFLGVLLVELQLTKAFIQARSSSPNSTRSEAIEMTALR